jgi:hypothetical protein
MQLFSIHPHISGEWPCRVAMSSDHQFYIPLSIPLWGVAESDHIHINNHMNFVFHAEKGKVIAAAAYPGKKIVK